MLSMQMKKGMASRLGGRPLWQDARVQSQTVYEGSVVVAVRLDANLPLKPGDRVQVWPPARKRKKANNSSWHHHHHRHSRCPQGSSSPEYHDDDDDASSSNESDYDDDADVEPRFYSIARAIPDVADDRMTDLGAGGGEGGGRGQGMTITLTVGQHSPEGLVSSFLSTAAPGTHLRLRPWPSPRFRQPRNLAVPLVLVGQGSGVGPFVGFLHDRVAWAQRRLRHRDDAQQDDMVEKEDEDEELGEVLLVVAAKTRRHVPCPLDSLEQLTRALPLTIILALSEEEHHLMIRSGTWTQLPTGDRHITRHLLEHRDFVQRLVKEKGGHVFVCGSSDFGATAMSSLGLGQPQQQHQEQEPQQQQAQYPHGVSYSYNDNHTHMPSAPPHWNQLHQDLFVTVKRPSSTSPTSPRFSSSSSSYSYSSSSSSSSSSSHVYASPSSPSLDPRNTIITPSSLAAHNSINSCWTAIGGTVYDMTSFLAMHPGGPKTILESAGTIADARFAETHGGPHAQEIKGYLQRYAIGRLSTSATGPVTQTTSAKLTSVLVRMQNALTNNSAFDASRGPLPLYVYEDALLVFADSLDGVVGILSDAAVGKQSSEQRAAVLKTQALLRKAFTLLKTGCKGCLFAAGSESSSSTLLEESEALVQRLYREPIKKVHAAVDACKRGLSEIETETEADSDDKICDAQNDENDDALKRVWKSLHQSSKHC
ncbi:hypothetical protein CH063_14015 [Colletotrichum higginsianum]|uniref:Uncharacterized protein n=1 Tax=Colletotrichum higginsianum (strain IMI 349063) TaxID=759273 RepID=H1VWU1_COLHI|nr:hypothetical protein CH063_14015 [Colletotrichum higginsianum]